MTTTQAPDPRRTEYLPLSALQADPRNPKAHDDEVIEASIGRFGMLDPIVRDDRTGYIISGHGRRNSLAAMEARGESAPEGIRTDPETGEWLVPVVVGWSSRTDAEAGAALIALNRTTELGGWVDESLLELLDDLSEMDDGLLGVGFTEEEFESLRHALEVEEYHEERKEQYEEGAKKESVKRTIPLDLIFSSSAATSAPALMGYALGWHPGVITSAVNSARRYRERFPRSRPIMFMDNEWHGYDHEAHVSALSEFHPKYATVRDLVTQQQAEEFGVEYYTIEETLKLAEDVAEHCENVILIPKYDCLDKLPREISGKRVVLGYSVESSYGGTEIPPERFAGWPVHLLGGPWKKQRAILNILKDDVVSLDNNNVLKVAQFASVSQGDGTSLPLDTVLGKRYLKNHLTLSLMLSLANIIEEVVSMYEVEVDDEADAELVELAESVEDNVH